MTIPSQKWKEPCFVCVTQDVCRNRGECVQKDAWPEPEADDLAELILFTWLQTVCPANECLPGFRIEDENEQ